MKVLAVDFGATNAKIFEVELGERLLVREVKRFRTGAVFLPASERIHAFWDLPRFYQEVVEVLEEVREVRAIGIDSWGVDFALLDSKGRLLSLPYHYRDERTKGVMAKALDRVPRERIYERTGIQFMEINTLYQLYSMVLGDDELLNLAETFLMVPDVFNYWLTGVKVCEYTDATTTQCYSVPEGNWAFDILEELGIPTKIFPEVVKPGTVLGKCRLNKGIEVIATTSHDTASAVVAVPFEEEAVYVSSGTWFLIGVELETPLIKRECLEKNFTNEGGYGKIRFLKNATGMWLLEECNKVWRMDYETILKEAESARGFVAYVDPDHPDFLYPGNMPEKIFTFLKRTSQPLPETRGEAVRSILEGIAFNCAWVVEQVEELTGKAYGKVHVVGGATRNDLLMQFIANATGKIVVAGPQDATPIGNALVQLMALGEIENLCEARRIVRESFELRVYEPKDEETWKFHYERWRKIKEGKVCGTL